MVYKATIISIVISVCATCSAIGLLDRHDYSLVAEAFKNHGIVPKYLKEGPKELLQVSIQE